MTKVCGRDRKTAEAHLHDSLRRLQTDCIDVWQFHEINYDNDADLDLPGRWRPGSGAGCAPSGQDSLHWLHRPQEPSYLDEMLAQDFDWDTCQLPVNVLDAHYRSFQNEVLPDLARRGIGAIGMKSLGGGGQLITELGLTAEQCRRYALSLPISTLVCGIASLENLEQDLHIARSSNPCRKRRGRVAGLRLRRGNGWPL